MTDYISRADAIDAVRYLIYDRQEKGAKPFKWWFIQQRLNAIPSAELPKGDLISRQWLLELYGDYIGDNGEPKYHVPLEVVRQNIKDAPSADAVQGEWVHDGQKFKGGLDWCHCSECGYKTSTNGLSVYRYCPSCGARMTPYKGGDDE